MADSPAPTQAPGIPQDVAVATPATDVQRANRALAARAGLPDGPNVGPSSEEHLAAQGRVRAAGPSPGGAGPAEPPQSNDPEVSPEEQELVEEQIQRDRQASNSTDPSVP